MSSQTTLVVDVVENALSMYLQCLVIHGNVKLLAKAKRNFLRDILA